MFLNVHLFKNIFVNSKLFDYWEILKFVPFPLLLKRETL